MARAWIVSDGESMDVVYANNPFVARREGTHVLNEMLYEDEIDVERAPEFDDLGGRSLREVQLERGWSFSCYGCGGERLYNDEGAKVRNGEVFCAKCLEAKDA